MQRSPIKPKIQLPGFGLELAGAAAMTLWPEQHLIAWAMLILGLILIIFPIFQWLLTHHKQGVVKRRYLSITPKLYDSLIGFEPGTIDFDLKYFKENPFTFLIRNLSDSNITNIRIYVELIGVNLKMLIEQSEAFMFNEPRENGEHWITTKKNSDGKDGRYYSVNYETSGKRVIDMLCANGEAVEFELPDQTQKAMRLCMLAYSCRDKTLQSTEELTKLGELFDDREAMFDSVIKGHTERISELPDIKLKTSWVESNNQQKDQITIIRSIYTGSADWFENAGTGELWLEGRGGILAFRNDYELGEGYYNKSEKWRTIDVAG